MLSGRSRRPGFLCICVIVLLAGAGPALAVEDELIVFYSLYDTGSGWETDASGKYVVYPIGLSTADGDFTRWNADADPNCGIAVHKAGDAGWPGHYHVHRSNNSSTPWTAAYPGELIEGNKAWCKKYYEVKILNNGDDPNASPFAMDDGQDDDCQFGDPNFKTNCYGYAFDQTGVDNYKDVILFDGSTGADRVVSTTAALYKKIPGPSDAHDTVMYMAGRHANYVYIANEDCRIDSLKFKHQVSQTFEYDWDPPGRNKSSYWWGVGPSPKYYIED